MQQSQTLHQALTRHLSSNNDLQELLIHMDEDPHATQQEHQLIEQALHALYDCSGSIRTITQEVQNG